MVLNIGIVPRLLCALIFIGLIPYANIFVAKLSAFVINVHTKNDVITIIMSMWWIIADDLN